MSIDDATMWTYHQLLLESEPDAIDALKEAHPMQVKKDLAQTLVRRFHSEAIAENERTQFEQVFSKNKHPDEMPTFRWEALSPGEEKAAILILMHSSGLFESKGAIRRLITQGGVKLNGEKVNDPLQALLRTEDTQIIQGGKRIFFKII